MTFFGATPHPPALREVVVRSFAASFDARAVVHMGFSSCQSLRGDRRLRFASFECFRFMLLRAFVAANRAIFSENRYHGSTGEPRCTG